MILFIAILVVAWIALSGFFLISVCMMASVSNRAELRTENQFPRHGIRIGAGISEENQPQQTAEATMW